MADTTDAPTIREGESPTAFTIRVMQHEFTAPFRVKIERLEAVLRAELADLREQEAGRLTSRARYERIAAIRDVLEEKP